MKGHGPHPPRGPAREAPSGSRGRRRRAAPTTAGCRPPRASRGSAASCHGRPPVEHSPAHQRCLSAQVAGRRRLDRETRIGCGATAVPVCGGSDCARRGVGSRSPLVVSVRRRRWRPGSWSGCRAAPTSLCRPPRPDLSSAPVRTDAIARLELEQLLHLVLSHAVRSSRRLLRACIRVAVWAVGPSGVRAQAFDVERRGPSSAGRAASATRGVCAPCRNTQHGKTPRPSQRAARPAGRRPGGLAPVLPLLQQGPHFRSHAPHKVLSSLAGPRGVECSRLATIIGVNGVIADVLRSFAGERADDAGGVRDQRRTQPRP